MNKILKIKPSQIILFDIDHTMHDPHVFRKIYKQKLKEHLAIDEEKFEKARENYDKSLPKKTFFHPNTYTAHLAKEMGLGHQVLRRHYYHHLNYKESLFDEAVEVLEELKKIYVLGVFSEGYKVSQMRKLKKSGLLHFFDPRYLFIFFNKRTKRVLELLPENAVVVDDREAVIEILLQRKDLMPIWLNRTEQKKHSKAHTIHSLEELLLLV